MVQLGGFGGQQEHRAGLKPHHCPVIESRRENAGMEDHHHPFQLLAALHGVF